MSYDRFIEELNKRYKITGPQQLDGRRLQNYSFASGTRSRGLKFIESMEKEAGFDFRGVRILDVGCAYGGFCIEAARKGARAYGIDINDGLLELAMLNAQNEEVDGEIHFLKIDATSGDLLKLLPRNFDFVVVNDVFEHVYDTAKLLNNISVITADNATLYFQIPNGLCTQSIRKEGHRWIPGISIMDPSYWYYRVKQHFSIYYRRWEYYAALLSYYGFGDIRLLNFGKTFDGDRAQLTKHLEVEFEDITKAISDDLELQDSIAQSYRQALLTRIAEVEKEMQEDLNSLSDAELCWKYLTAFWKGIAVKGTGNTVTVKQHQLARASTAVTEQVIKNSFSYRLGNMLVQAVYKPRRNTIFLPYRLVRLCVTELRKRKARTYRSVKYTEIRLTDVKLSTCTDRIKKKYIERFGVDKGRLGWYGENDWKRIEYISTLLPEAKSVLDIGISNGAFLNLLISLNRFQRILGIDIIRHPQFTKLFGSHLYQIMYASVVHLPFANKCIDVVTCMELLEHLDKQSFMAALHELRRVSRFLVITVPYNEPEPLPSYHKLRFTHSDLLTYFPHGEFTLLRKSAGAAWMVIAERS